MITIIFNLNHIIPFEIKTEHGMCEFIACNLLEFKREIEGSLHLWGWRNEPYRINDIMVKNYMSNVLSQRRFEVIGDVEMEIELK